MSRESSRRTRKYWSTHLPRVARHAHTAARVSANSAAPTLPARRTSSAGSAASRVATSRSSLVGLVDNKNEQQAESEMMETREGREQ